MTLRTSKLRQYRDQARSIATKPIGPLPAGLPAVEAAAFTLVGNALLNLDETLMKR